MNPVLRSLALAPILASGAGLAAQDAKHEPDAAVQPKVVRADGGQRPGAEAAGGNSWFDVTNRDLGTYYGEGDAVGVFAFANPGDGVVEWSSLTPSCQCAMAVIRVEDRTYRLISKPSKQLVRVVQVPGQPEKLEPVESITIGGHEKGEVEAHLDMNNITGPKQATLDIHSTDEKLPHTRLSFRATGAQLFSISPKEVNLNKMTWNETREFTVTVQSPLRPDWAIVGMDDAGEAFDVRWEKSTVGDHAVWTIHGTYGPVNADVGGGGVLRFRTDVNGGATFNVRVLAFVQGPLEAKPGGFLTLGLIRKGSETKKEVVFEPNDGVELEATRIEFQKMSMSSEFVTATTRKDGDKLIVELAVSADAPKGLVKGDMVVHLNHPVVQEKRIMFNGFVR